MWIVECYKAWGEGQNKESSFLSPPTLLQVDLLSFKLSLIYYPLLHSP